MDDKYLVVLLCTISIILVIITLCSLKYVDNDSEYIIIKTKDRNIVKEIIYN